jgi:hypothetical protein
MNTSGSLLATELWSPCEWSGREGEMAIWKIRRVALGMGMRGMARSWKWREGKKKKAWAG